MKLNMKSTNLNNQVFVYSLDTSAFYSNAEHEIHIKLTELYLQRKEIRKKIKQDAESKELKNERKEINKKIEALKKGELFGEFAKHKGIRKLREDSFTYEVKDTDGNPTGERKQRKKVVISMFESALTRTLGMQTNTLSTNIIIVQQVYSDVMENIVKNGFEHNNEQYIYFSSSAGQIRKKKCVFVNKKVWDEFKPTLMCGVSLDKINEKGNNINKYLAYLSLQDSASTLFQGFDIDRMIVVEDWEFDVKGEVDYIDKKTFEIERKTMKVPMNIVDGAGMCLPSVSQRSFQFRAPWVKGLISPMDFKGWVMQPENRKYRKVKDIWGKPYDIVKDRIEIMITRSMFKMHSHYASWKEYKDYFKLYKCTAGVCQVEAKHFGNVRLGYQMIQSLNEITNDELDQVVNKTVQDIHLIGKNKDTMLKMLGATKENRDKNHYQSALMLYPELLNDDYSRKMIKDTKRSIVKGAKAGKVEVSGKYLFVVPDWVAYLEWLLKNENEPKGLIEAGDIYSSLFADGEKVDIMRSPSLYREHGIRINKVNDKKKKWLVSNGVYVSYKDLLGKQLQMDFDGDQLFVVNEKCFVSVADRHMKDVVPLHYEMKKAPIGTINNDSIWDGLKTAFEANIGDISNKISVCWSRPKPNLKVIAWLTYLNNVEIDFAKTQWRPEIPPHVQKEINENTKGKLPNFFRYAKDKSEQDVEIAGECAVDRLGAKIPKTRIHFVSVCGNFDYRMLMSQNKEDIIISPLIVSAYHIMDLKKWRMESSKNKNKNGDNLFVYRQIRDGILNLLPDTDIKEIVDMLVEYLYKHTESDFKVTLWSAFGDVLLENLKRNLGIYKNCEDCQGEFEGAHNAKLCVDCAGERQKEAKRLYKLKEREGDKVGIE